MTPEQTPEELETNPEWRDTLLGTSPILNRYRRLFRHIPSEPRCKVCLSPQGGIGGPLMKVLGYGRYPPNPQLCNSCFRQAESHPGGAEIEMAALFADVRGSTGLAETMSPAAYSAAIAEYVQAASRAIREPGGLVDKLLGDGVMALFVPGFVVGGDHAGAAVAAGREILRNVRLPVGIGVHTGPAWVGFVGGIDGVLDFTALGDAVNVASRLASEAAAGELLLSHSTVVAAHVPTDRLAARRLELRGRAEGLDAWSERFEPAPAAEA
ncbi:MAG: adenylate/guanylate cyclase domain-containing protein [Candidatus Limnocylindria bacterium]